MIAASAAVVGESDILYDLPLLIRCTYLEMSYIYSTPLFNNGRELNLKSSCWSSMTPVTMVRGGARSLRKSSSLEALIERSAIISDLEITT